MTDAIFLANGHAGPDAFPSVELANCFADVLRDHGDVALQYGPPEGLEPLRRLVAGWLQADGVTSVTPDDVLIVGGAKQALALLGRFLARPGDAIATSTPTYMTALQIFRSLGLVPHGIACDEDGLRTDLLKRALEHRVGSLPGFVYEMPDFSNPTAAVLAPQRRQQLVELAERFDLPIVEDSAYRWLALDGEAGAPLRSFGAARQLITVGSFSKILAPGLRLAWIVAHTDVRKRLLDFWFEFAPSPLVQLAVQRYFSTVALADHLQKSRALYRGKRDVALAALASSMPSDVRWNLPGGGYYVWLEIDGVDTDAVCALAGERGVLLYPGSAFFPDHPPVPRRSHLRLNYAHETHERIAAGVCLLADVVGQLRSGQPGRVRTAGADPAAVAQ